MAVLGKIGETIFKMMSLANERSELFSLAHADDVRSAIACSGLLVDDFQWEFGADGPLPARVVYRGSAFFSFDAVSARGLAFEYRTSRDPVSVCGRSLNWPQQLRRFTEWLRTADDRSPCQTRARALPIYDPRGVVDVKPIDNRWRQFVSLERRLAVLQRASDTLTEKDWKVVLLGVGLTLSTERLVASGPVRAMEDFVANRALAWIARSIAALQIGHRWWLDG